MYEEGQVEGSEEQGTYRSAGEQLRAAREEQELTLEAVATRTRIPLRHLETIEAGHFDELPGRTYAVGFSRNYANAIGLDGEAIADAVRNEMAENDYHRPAHATGDTFEPGDPARVPSGKLTLVSILAGLLLLAGVFVFYRTFFVGGANLPSLLDDGPEETGEQVAATTGPPAQAVSGPVVLTSLEDGIWVRIYDGEETDVLAEKLLGKGETYEVPASASQPLLRTGRPDALSIRVGTRDIGPLADSNFVMSGQSLDARVLAEGGEDEASADAEAADTEAEPADE